MKMLFEDLESFISFLVEKEAKELFYSIKVEVSDLTETPEGVGRLNRATIILQAPIGQRLAMYFKGFEQFITSDKEAKKFEKAIEDDITETLDMIKKRITDISIHKGVVEI